MRFSHLLAWIGIATFSSSCAIDQINEMRKAVQLEGREKFGREGFIKECTKSEAQFSKLVPGKFDISIYPEFLEFLRKGQASVARAHTRSGMVLIAKARELSLKKQFHEHVELLDHFSTTWLAFAEKPEGERNLHQELKDLVAALSYYEFDTDVCSNPSLRGFYLFMLAFLDPNGEIALPGMVSSEAEVKRSLLKVDLDDSKVPGVRIEKDPKLGEWARITVRSGDDAEILEKLAQEYRKERELALESRKGSLPVWLELGGAYGTELKNFAPLANELARSSDAPVVIKIDSVTRGSPEELASELSKYPHVLVVGAPSLGLRRGICAKEIRFAPQAEPYWIAIRCGSDAGSTKVLPDQYREDDTSSRQMVEQFQGRKILAWVLKKFAREPKPWDENVRLRLPGDTQASSSRELQEKDASELDARKLKFRETRIKGGESAILKAWKEAP